MEKKDLSKFNLPDTAGVYMFLGKGGEILYIGKAVSIRARVKSYFTSDLVAARGEHVWKMLKNAIQLTWQETDSVLEALIIEANLIKKHQPKANSRDRDNKSFNYLVITKEEYPRVVVVRGRELFYKWDKNNVKYFFGPFPEGGSLKEALKLVRKIFPFRDTCIPCGTYEVGHSRPCFNRQIGLCPGVCDGSISKRAYTQTIRHIALLFSGKKKTLVEKLGGDMKRAVRAERFEEAHELKRQIGALKHIRDVALIRRDAFESRGGDITPVRIEAYDVAHTAGTETVGVMVVVENGEPKKNEYRMFKVLGAKNDDIKALREILNRRFVHHEWPMPKLIVIDGGKGQLNVARKVLEESGVGIPLVAVVKDERHRPREIIGDEPCRSAREREILLANVEAHRFALAYHRRRRKSVIIKE